MLDEYKPHREDWDGGDGTTRYWVVQLDLLDSWTRHNYDPQERDKYSDG